MLRGGVQLKNIRCYIQISLKLLESLKNILEWGGEVLPDFFQFCLTISCKVFDQICIATVVLVGQLQ